MILIRSLCIALFCLLQTAHAQEGPVPRSSLFVLEKGDRLVDSGVMVVGAGSSARTEAFEVVRRADGGRTLTSITTTANTDFPAEGRWQYDANEQAMRATAKTRYSDMPVDIEIEAAPPFAKITVQSEGVVRSIPAPCDPDCLIDFSPSALPMFTMTRQYNIAQGGIQSFRFVGQSFFTDRSTLGRVQQMRFIGKETLQTPSGDALEVLQFVFADDVSISPLTGFAFNIWVDADHRPLAFDTPGATRGIRIGYDFVVAEMPPNFD